MAIDKRIGKVGVMVGSATAVGNRVLFMLGAEPTAC